MSSDSTSRREFLQRASVLAGGATLAGSLLLHCSRSEFDLIIRDAAVYTGTGEAPLRTDVGVRDGRIVAVENLRGRRAKEVVQARGLALAPGFIDVHGHTDIELFVDGRAQSKVQQGVTTEISGNCGSSPFPLLGQAGERRKKRWAQKYHKVAVWTDAAGFLEALERAGIAYNYATLVGHGTLRETVVGEEDRPPTRDELREMKRLLNESLAQGAFGLSTGLEYAPGAFATTDELVELARVLPAFDVVYATHMRNEDVYLIEAIEEAIEIGRRAQCSVEVSHLKACQPRNWHLVDRALELIDGAVREGLNIHDDRYPYTAYSTTARALFPIWSREGGTEAFVGRLKDGKSWDRIASYVLEKVQNLGGWKNIQISDIGSEEKQSWAGRSLLDLASEQRQRPLNFLRQLMVEEHGQVSVVVFAMSEENLEKILRYSRTMIGSDGTAREPDGLLGEGHPHPRSYGTFPRFLGRYVRERKVLSLEEAIRRATWLPAQKFGLHQRGQIAPGYYADLVLFDPEKIVDRATYADPQRYPAGIELVVVNGTVVVRNGQHTGALPGRVLRRGTV